MESVLLQLTSAVVLDGAIARAGSLVEVTENEAKNLLRRGKAVIPDRGKATLRSLERELSFETSPPSEEELQVMAGSDATLQFDAEADPKPSKRGKRGRRKKSGE